MEPLATRVYGVANRMTRGAYNRDLLARRRIRRSWRWLVQHIPQVRIISGYFL